MGLDMYMYRCAKFEGVTPSDVAKIKRYLDWKTHGKKHTMKEWCGLTRKDIDPLRKAIEYYKDCYHLGNVSDPFGYYTIFNKVAYWRKVNAVHNWFVENVQGCVDDCGHYLVTKEDLRTLLDTCQYVVDNTKLSPGKIKNGTIFKNGEWSPCWEDGEIVLNPEIAMEMLPPTAGFFFGCTDINGWYIEDLKDTINQINKILEETDFETEMICYHSSW